MTQKTMPDPIIADIHRIRREISEKFDGDFAAMLDDARRRQAASGRPIWKPGQQPVSAPVEQAHP